jgi:ATP-dependent RNA helicase DDX10/DBP4
VRFAYQAFKSLKLG